MFVDIHTHHITDSGQPAIRNLTFPEADTVFSSDQEGLFSLGFHPWYAGEFTIQLMDKLMVWSADERFVAVGECGLDKNSKVPFDVQLQVFERQIILSENILKPLIVHCVGSFNELFQLKKHLHPHQPWIIHGFRGKPELAGQALQAGCSLSFGEHFNPESVHVTPIGSLFVETDQSQLSITEIYQSISSAKHCNVQDLDAGENFIRQTRQNIYH